MDIPIFDFLRRQVGLRTDVASSTGSLHGKVGDLKNMVDAQFALVQKPRGPAGSLGSYGAQPGNNYVTALSLSGIKGELLGLRIKANVNSVTANIKITIDGYVIAEGATSSFTSNVYQYPTNQLFYENTRLLAPAGVWNLANMPFKNSLKIEVKDNSGGAVWLTIEWLYLKEG